MKDYRKYFKLTLEQVEEVKKLYQCRIPITHIARHYNISNTAIRYHVKDLPVLEIPEIIEHMNINHEAEAA